LGVRETKLARLALEGGRGELRARMVPVVDAFQAGLHAALEEGSTSRLTARLGAMPTGLAGFAFEGAGLGLAALDILAFGRGRHFRSFTAGPGAPHAYMMHVGAGWMLGRWPFPADLLVRRFDPFLRWAALDGYGFFEGLTRRPLRVERRRSPGLSGAALRSYDVGLGRSLWFTCGAEVASVAAAVGAFDAARRPDLWSGLGIACSYTGWVDRQRMAALAEAAGSYRPQLCQGVTVSAWARQRAGNPTLETEMACRVLAGLSAEAAAERAEAALRDLPAEGEKTQFEIWRQRVRDGFADPGGRLRFASR